MSRNETMQTRSKVVQLMKEGAPFGRALSYLDLGKQDSRRCVSNK